MPIKNCVKCGTPLSKIAEREWFCPNHGVIVENREWNNIEKKEKKEKKNDN